jgi:hypothetical protein
MEACRCQLEALFWLCPDAENVVAATNEMSSKDAAQRKKGILELCEKSGLLDYNRLVTARALNADRKTVCPLCLDVLSAAGFLNRLAQAEGREVPDLTVTQLNLFHVKELRVGVFNHRPYNLAWGHHHCNTVTKDSGIEETLQWMYSITERNIKGGHFTPKKSGI